MNIDSRLSRPLGYPVISSDYAPPGHMIVLHGRQFGKTAFWDDYRTHGAIREVVRGSELAGAHTSIHYVPSSKYEKPSFGDERLMTPAEWVAIAAPTSIVEFNDGYDLALIWEFR